jgi:hypothetical protein
MPPSGHAHEAGIVSIHDGIFSAMKELERRYPKLKRKWWLQCNRSVHYERMVADESSAYQADLTLYCCIDALFHLEITFTQRWGDLLSKVGRILEDPNCWGVLVIRIQEASQWSSPKQSFKRDDFILPSDWDAMVELMQEDRPYGGVLVGGNEWTKDVDVDICLFPSTWMEGDAEPTLVCHGTHYHVTGTHTPLQYRLNPSGNINFTTLDAELDGLWRNISRDFG